MTDLAFVLCAGLGERLRPMTLATPKPLVPIWNRPLLAHTLDTLAGWGVREVFLNTHWLPEALRAFIAAYRGPLTLHELHEPDLLGTGGALRNLAPHLKGRPFWLVNGDVVFHADPAPLAEAFEASGRFAAAWLEPKRGPRTVELDYAGRVTCWRSPTPGVDRTYTFTGVSLLSPDVLSFLPDRPVCSLVDAFENAAFSNRFVRGVLLPESYWNDAGTPAAYIEAHRDAKRLPALARYASGAADTPPAPVAQALAAIKWPVGETIVAPLGARGSKRTFWRLSAPRRSAIAIAYETEGRAENARYAACAKALAKAHVAVPKVLLDLPNLLVMEDLGDDTFDRHVAAVREDCLRGSEAPGHEGHRHGSPRLRQVMELLAAFHRAEVGDLPLEPPFDAALYAWEVSLHEQFAAPFPPEAKAELARIQDALLTEPAVLVHRDFQSSNILWHAKAPALIDFQGMRRGPALYDLASFLYDPYVDWGEAAQEAAIDAYAEAANRDAEELRAKLPLAGIQRLTQAIGAYHRLASVGQPRFLAYVPIARARAAALAEKAQLPALTAFFKD